MNSARATLAALLCTACAPELFVSTVTRLNHPPEPVSDSYLGAAGAALAIAAADGVLANDLDPDGDALTAHVGVPPTVGALELALDGGFVYTPNTGFVGVDTFSYLASDGNEQVSATVTVQINAVDNPPLAWATAAPLAGAAPLTVSFDGSASNDDRGIAGYAWSFGDGASGVGVTTEHTYDTAGSWIAELTVTDTGGTTDRDTLTIDVTAPIPSRSAWTARDQNPGQTWVDSTWSAYTIRNALLGAHQTLRGSTVAVLLRPRTSGDYTIEHLSLARRDGSTLDVDDTTFAQVTFGGGWDEPVTVPAGCPVLSDPVDFELDGSDVFATFYATGATTYIELGTGTNTWAVAGDESATLDWEGLTLADSNAHVYAVDTLALVGSFRQAAPILVGHWPLDEVSGSRADATGRGNELVETGTVTVAAGVRDRAARFDGGSFLSITDDTQVGLDVASGLTLAAHFNPTNVDGTHTVAAKLDNNGNQRSYRIRVEAGALFATLSGDGITDLNLGSAATLAVGTWHHVALVFDPCDDTATLYLDGNVAASGAAGYNLLYDSTTNFTVGARMDAGAGSELFEGLIDDVRIYTTPLSQAEVQELAE